MERAKRAWRKGYWLRLRNLARPKPRVCVFRSNRRIYAQVVDDLKGRTLAHSSSYDLGPAQLSLRGEDRAAEVGRILGERTRGLGLGSTSFVYDLRGLAHHGRVARLVASFREALGAGMSG